MRSFLLFLFGFVFFSFLLGQDQKTDFSGTWNLDESKSEMGDSPGGRGRRMAINKMNVTQEDNKLTVESFRTNRDGEEISTTDVYTLDGKKCENKSENRTSVSTADWEEKGKSLLIITKMTFSRGDRSFTMDSETTWSIAEGNLILDSVRSTPRGEMKSKLVYTKEAK
jgi:hypothetical protein